jgi:hypothetical protein
MSDLRTPEDRRYYVLKKLSQVDHSLSMTDMAPMIAPETVRTMAARGLIRVRIDITPAGAAYLEAEESRRAIIAARKAAYKRRAQCDAWRKKAKAETEPPQPATTPIFVPASSLVRKVG